MTLPDPSLPLPDAAARDHAAIVASALRARIGELGGWMPFHAYMQLVLHEPHLGYYAAGARKFGAAGDFVTAPELTKLFAQALAVQVRAIVGAAGTEVVELGAGTGALAADLLASLDEGGVQLERYRILELSAELRERQRETLRRRVPALAARVEWLDALPAHIDGAVLLNEVLDAIAVRLIARRRGRWLERGVRVEGSGFALEDRPLADARIEALAAARFPAVDDYESELNPDAEALVETLGRRLRRGAIVVIDYGFTRREYYHPQRSAGTLIGHYRHRAHADPLLWPGLSDLTAHVDFTAVAEAGARAGLHVAGFTSQEAFLLGCGILDRLKDVAPPESSAYIREASAVQRLLSPAEMGELFKVLALARSEGIAWPGFSLADRRHRL